MSDCNGCYDGCQDIISDQCVKYTGSNISFLDISTGDTLAIVEQKIVAYLLTVLNGEGIVPDMSHFSNEICSLVEGHLPQSGDITLLDVISALIQSICDLQVQITNVSSSINTIEGSYTIGACFSGVLPSSGTHDILQAVINRLCSVVVDVNELNSNIDSYVKITDINTYIQQYLESIGVFDDKKHYLKMVPYTAVEYYGNIAGNFDSTGKGVGDWEQVYLCNGLNNTPDKRGRIAIGTNNEMGTNAYIASSETDPAGGNPNYTLFDTAGTNAVSLIPANLPAHSHGAQSVVSDPGHKHLFAGDEKVVQQDTYLQYSSSSALLTLASVTQQARMKNIFTKNVNGSNTSQTTGITVNTIIANSGDNVAHENRPPVLACHYIMYIPD